MTGNEIMQTLLKVKDDQDAVIAYDEDVGDDDSYRTYVIYKAMVGGHIEGTTRSGCRTIIAPDKFKLIQGIRLVKKGYTEKINKTRHDKKPFTGSRHIGVEIELISKFNVDEMELMIANHDLEEFVCVKDDGSIDIDDEYPFSHEFAILADERIIYRVIRRLCKLIQTHSKVNRSCGLHVHIDMRSKDHCELDEIYANLFAAQPLLYSMCPPSRAKGQYCIPDLRYQPFRNYENDERYVGVNREAYNKHETFEIRIHSGTLNVEKINNWIRLLLKIVDNPIESVDNPTLWNDYKQIKKALKIRGKLDKYIQARLNMYKDKHRIVKLYIAS